MVFHRKECVLSTIVCRHVGYTIIDITYGVDNDAKDRAISEARADVAAGRVVDHEIVAAWLARLAAGEDAPPPIPLED